MGNDKDDNEQGGRTVLDPGDVAVIYSEEKGYVICLPRGMDDASLPPEALALLAAGMRLTEDSSFREALVQWFSQRGSGGEGIDRPV
jgi:hypothetical protein